ncbi:helix-turn-helix domain-containing protein [Arenibacter echinorum]|uniref:Helix-turn-helix protein n=1 Tax=Arenibacter echinorum TaxID=440515 RepID=A0A327R840_9FLAO|nr:helix-turn-helix domain-containing protein [Arenibacter echinorum]RAJ11723.1 helix-turn-helix protein [Arenibacter echinorum]
MKPEERNFQGIWIPRSIYLNTEVNWYAKILFLEIHSFTENGMECYMSNKYIASFLHISERQVSRYISQLKSLGWIEETSFNGRKRFLRSLLYFGYDTGDPDMTLLAWKR